MLDTAYALYQFEMHNCASWSGKLEYTHCIIIREQRRLLTFKALLKYVSMLSIAYFSGPLNIKRRLCSTTACYMFPCFELDITDIYHTLHVLLCIQYAMYFSHINSNAKMVLTFLKRLIVFTGDHC